MAFKTGLARFMGAAKYLKPSWLDLLTLFIASNFYSAMQLATPYMVMLILDDVLPSQNYRLFNALIVAYLVLILLMVATSVLKDYLYKRVSLNVTFAIRHALFRHLETLDLQFHSGAELGDMISRLMDDVSNIDQLLSDVVNNLIINLVYLAFLIAVCLWLSWQITLISLVLLPVIAIAQKRYGRILNKKFERMRKRDADYYQYLQERLSLVELTKLFSREFFEFKRHLEKTKELIKLRLDLTLTETSSSATISILVMGSLLFVLWMGGLQVMAGVLTIGAFVAVFNYISNMFEPLGTLTNINVAIQMNLVSLNRVFNFLETQPRVKVKKGAKRVQQIRGDIELRGVTFAYEGKPPILKNLTLRIKRGETVAIVGKTGAGKSTVLKLISRFYDPQQGSVLVDGTDLRDTDPVSLRSRIGAVPQQPLLFHASVLENITYGDPQASMQRVEEAAKEAYADEFIDKLPGKYHYNVGSGASKLSGGQKQRIALARALLKDTDVLLFDEATSALDPDSEQKIRAAMAKAVKGKTAVIVAHRLSTLAHADRILVLDGGTVVESGSYSQLMKKKNGMFRKAYRQMLK